MPPRARGTPPIAAGTPQRAFPLESTAAASLVWAGIAAYAAIAAVMVGLWSKQDVAMQIKLLAASPLVLLVGCCLLLSWRSKLSPLLAFGPEDDQPPPKAWTAIAVGLIVAQAIGSAVYFRPDWDDGYYLGAVLDYEHSPSFNDRDPTTREMIGVNAPHRAMCLELWGAVLCRLIGADPQTLFHSLLPGPFVLTCYAAYAALFGQIVPRKWVPLALVGLSGYFLWGIGEQFGAANHFLIRVWQGKAVMLHLSFPLIAALVIQFSRQVELRYWLSLCAAVCCGLGFSSSAIFLAIPLISCLALALLPVMQGGRLKFLVLAAVACLPLLAEGVAIISDSRLELTTDVPEAASPDKTIGGQQVSRPLAWAALLVDQCARRGSAEILWLISVPVVAMLAGGPRSAGYLLWYPCVLLATFANPFLSFWVAEHITSQEGYYRLFWLLPVGPGLAVCFSLLARAGGQLLQRRSSRCGVWLPPVVTLAGVGLLAALPGTFVWSAANRFGPYMFPSLGRNLEKMPPDLREIVRLLDRDPAVERGRILCGEEVAAYLVPWSARYRYVMVRAMYLPAYGLNPEYREASERFFLTCVLNSGRYGDLLYRSRLLVGHVRSIPAEMLEGRIALPEPPSKLPRLTEVPALVDRFQVEYAITSLPQWLTGPDRYSFGRQLMAERDQTLVQLGFEQVYAGLEHSLWKRRASDQR